MTRQMRRSSMRVTAIISIALMLAGQTGCGQEDNRASLSEFLQMSEAEAETLTMANRMQLAGEVADLLIKPGGHHSVSLFAFTVQEQGAGADRHAPEDQRPALIRLHLSEEQWTEGEETWQGTPKRVRVEGAPFLIRYDQTTHELAVNQNYDLLLGALPPEAVAMDLQMVKGSEAFDACVQEHVNVLYQKAMDQFTAICQSGGRDQLSCQLIGMSFGIPFFAIIFLINQIVFMPFIWLGCLF